MGPDPPGRRTEVRLSTDLKALLDCLRLPVECAHCGHVHGTRVGPLKSDGVFTCPACGRTAMIDAGGIDQAVADAAGQLQEQALALGRSLPGSLPSPDSDRPRPAGRADDEPN